MRVTVVGCAGSFPNADSAASCYLLEAEGFRLVIDMGNGALGALQRYAPLFGVDAICLSHLHGDHCLDLGAYAVARHYYGPGGIETPLPPVPVYAPAGARERLAPAFGLVADELTDGFTFEQLAPGSFEIGPFAVTTAHMNHTVETFGFRISQAGWTMAYSADTGESAALVDLARDADLLLAEATFLDRPGNPVGVHLSARQTGEHAAKAEAGRLVLTHLVAMNDAEVALAEAASVFAGPVSLASPGECYGPATPR
jgi:ribonuclease BN (tRNA processing enzyme)